MIQRLLLAAALAVGLSSAAQAQLARVFTDCAIPTTLGTRDGVSLIVDQNNKLCVTGVSGGGGGGGDASAANQQTQIQSLGNPADAAYTGTGNGNNISLSKGQFAILSNLLAANGSVADAAAATVGANGSQVALQKAIRDKLLGTVNTARPDKPGSGTLALATQDASLIIPIDGDGTLGINWSGLSGSGATVTYEQANGTGGYTVVSEFSTGTNTPSTTRTTDGNVRVPVQGHANIRLRVSTTGTGTATLSWKLSQVPFAMWVPNLPNDLAREGVDGAGTNPGTGIRGWLSGIYARLGGILTTKIDQTTPGTTNGVQITNPYTTTTTGALEPPTCATAAKCPQWFVSLAANTSTQLLPADTGRIAYSIQCAGAANVGVSEQGATLTAAIPSATNPASLVIPTGSTPPYFSPPIASRTVITGYTGTAQACWGTAYLR